VVTRPHLRRYRHPQRSVAGRSSRPLIGLPHCLGKELPTFPMTRRAVAERQRDRCPPYRRPRFLRRSQRDKIGWADPAPRPAQHIQRFARPICARTDPCHITTVRPRRRVAKTTCQGMVKPQARRRLCAHPTCAMIFRAASTFFSAYTCVTVNVLWPRITCAASSPYSFRNLVAAVCLN